jgi:hypothetical protein
MFPTAGDGGYKQREAARKKAEQEAIARNKQLAKLIKDQAKAATDLLKKKKLQNAIDKANLLLGKGEGVFDIEAIQFNAALINQAQQLGNTTNAAQMLQIANDVARLNVKKAMYELEQAIASGDIVAIQNATARLNEDLKIYSALSGQKTQMMAIESILKGLTPKELIDQKNLDEALRKIRELLAELAKVKMPTAGSTGSTGGFIQTPNGISPTTPPRSIDVINKAVEDLGGVVSVIGQGGKEFIKLVDGIAPVFQGVEDSGAFNALVNSFANGNVGSFDAGSFRNAEGGSIFNSGAVGSRDRDITITVNTGVGDPNAIAEAIDQVLTDAVQRGTLRGYTTA